MPDPIALVTRLSRPTIFAALIVAFLLLGSAMKRCMNPANDASRAAHPERKPCGIVGLERAGDEKSAVDLMREWGPRGRLLATFSLGLDALFIVIYVAALALGCRMAADGFGARGWALAAVAGAVLGWAAVAAGVLDAIENIGLIRMLDGETGTGWPRISRVCADLKFLFSGIALFYVLAAIAVLRGRFFT